MAVYPIIGRCFTSALRIIINCASCRGEQHSFPRMTQLASRRVVVTGIGLVTPLATGVKATWNKLINSESGVVSLVDTPGYEGYEQLPVQIAAVVRKGSKEQGGFDATEWLDKGDNGERTMAKFTHYAIAAAKQAMNDAKWIPSTDKDKSRTGVCIGSGMGSLDDLVTSAIAYNDFGYRKISPMFVPKILINMAAGHLTMKFGLHGPNHAASTACTTGAHSIGDAMRFIQYGDADVMIAGGSESCIHPLAIAGFCKAKSLAANHNATPTKASRPFDKDRSGFVIGEGSGILVLESLQHAMARNAPQVYAEIMGYGLSGDAYHMTAPPEDGSGAEAAMRRALEVAQINPGDVGYINAHATSTLLGDRAENMAIRRVFGNRITVSSTKGAIGHLLGAAGAVEAAFTVLSLFHGILPPTLNLYNPGDPQEEFDLNYVPLVAQEKKDLKVALTNSFGFGGTNASLCFKKFE